MNIRKKLKKEKSAKKNIIIFSILLMIFMTYVVIILNESGFFVGYQEVLTYAYICVIDLLLVAVILRTIGDNKFEFLVVDDKVKIKDGLFESHLTIPEKWIVYIDASLKKKSQDDIEILIVTCKGKKSKKLNLMSKYFYKNFPQYRNTYIEITESYPEKNFYYYIIKGSGSKKYYYLYNMYKKFYNVKFSQNALDYIKEFMQEYNL